MLTKQDFIESIEPVLKKLEGLDEGQKRLAAEVTKLSSKQSATETRMYSMEVTQKELLSKHESLALRQRTTELIEKILMSKLDSIAMSLDSLARIIKELDGKVDKQTEDMKDFFHETWTHMDKSEKTLGERINKIERHIRVTSALTSKLYF